MQVRLGLVPEDVADWPYRGTPAGLSDVGTRWVRLTPYHAWGNRGPATMRVWLPSLRG